MCDDVCIGCYPLNTNTNCQQRTEHLRRNFCDELQPTKNIKMELTNEELNDISKILYLKNGYGIQINDYRKIIVEYEKEKAKVFSSNAVLAVSLPSDEDAGEYFDEFIKGAEIETKINCEIAFMEAIRYMRNNFKRGNDR